MLYQSIRKACEKYHSCGYGSDYDTALTCYRDAFEKRRKGDSPDRPSHEEAWILLSFANGWNANMTATFRDVQCALSEIEPDLKKLCGKKILNVCLDDETRNLIGRSFEKLAHCNPRKHNEATGASKILHIINPDLFVMWDRSIVHHYGCGERILYTDFLNRMQELAKSAVNQVREKENHYSRETTIASLTGCRHTLAKALDEYNYVKFTLNDDAVWQAEYEPCNSP